MIAFPTPYTACHHKGLTYSVGVIRNRSSFDAREYPLVRCEQCHTVYFTRFPFTMWCRCDQPDDSVIFTDDPDQIDRRIKLEYGCKYDEHTNGLVYTVYRVSTDALPDQRRMLPEP
jgi:hypothetical protein